MKTTKTMPIWAIDLVTQVCKDYNRKLPVRVQWYKRQRGAWSSGFTRWNGKEIHISAGSNEYDQELVLLHELAHYLVMRTKKGRRESHSMRFWRVAFELYSRYGMELGYAIYREEHYRAKATWAYQEQLAKK
jgi:predicted metal-dependent hydrolase